LLHVFIFSIICRPTRTVIMEPEEHHAGEYVMFFVPPFVFNDGLFAWSAVLRHCKPTHHRPRGESGRGRVQVL
ncbi:hypothetical protein EDD16DRAFT_1557481, partial [Pisolithus croceorrhizus]